MNILNSYLRSKMDLSNIGFQRGDKESSYFCTPLHSRVLGWAGVDGIHFCKVKGFDEMIFVVNPTYEPGDYVHPVARNFEDFLRLVLACNDTAAIEQCWFMDREVFDDFLINNPPTEEAQSCLDAIRKKYKLAPMEDPFAYMQNLHHSFDYSQLQFSPEYYEIVPEDTKGPQAPEWKTTWNGDIFDMDPDSVGADPVSVQTHFHWAGIDWYVPEVYPFDQGVILYLLGRVDPARVPQYNYEDLDSPEGYERLMAENPLNLQVWPEMTVNGLALRSGGSTGTSWMPLEGCNLEGKWVLQHYELDLDSAWQINRIKFFWPECGRMELKEMSLTMIQNSVSMSGTHFRTPLEGESVILTHPQTVKEYTLWVDVLQQETADFGGFHDQEMEYPGCYTQMTFRIDPNMTRNQFRIVDCAQSDQPKHRMLPESDTMVSAVSIGIIGGADGPTAIMVGHPMESAGMNHTAMSSLHFEPVEEIEWRIVFQEKPNEDMTISLK